MIRTLVSACACAAVVLLALPTLAAGDFATPEEAEAMVQKAIQSVKDVGKEKTLGAITGQEASWVDRDLYLAVFDHEGNNLAHGQNPKMVGKNFLGAKDADGTAFITVRMNLAKTKTSFWHDYKFKDPITKQILPKTSYCQTTDELVICAGVYKR